MSDKSTKHLPILLICQTEPVFPTGSATTREKESYDFLGRHELMVKQVYMFHV